MEIKKIRYFSETMRGRNITYLHELMSSMYSGTTWFHQRHNFPLNF